jgi:hypothetical protein
MPVFPDVCERAVLDLKQTQVCLRNVKLLNKRNRVNSGSINHHCPGAKRVLAGVAAGRKEWAEKTNLTQEQAVVSPITRPPRLGPG